MFVAKLVAWFADRELTLFGAWKLCGAALMPGTLLVALALRLYDWLTIDLMSLSFFYLGHLVMGLIYVLGSPLACPKLAAPTENKPPPKNPFAS